MRRIGLALAACLMAAAPSPTLAQENDRAQISDGDVEVVQSNLDAYRAGSMTAFLATFADDALLVYQGMTFRGRAEIRTAFSLNFQPGAPTLYLLDSGVQGEQIWIHAGYTFPDGSDMCCSLSRYTVNDGRIVRLEVSGPN